MVSNGDRALAKRSFHIGWISLVIGVLALALSIYAVKDQILYQVKIRSIHHINCPDLMTHAHQILMTESRAPAPPRASIRFAPSTYDAGRLDAYVAWQNRSDLSSSAIAVRGLYGERAKSDERIDHREPSASSGQCWNWYTYGARNDEQPQTVDILVPGLWPDQTYCFYNMFKLVGSGWSKPTRIECLKTPWKESWGMPASP